MKGVHTALVTPFANGVLDLDAYKRLARRQLGAGVAGLVPCGTTGETPTLTRSEWADCISTCVELAGDDVMVTAGCGTNATASTVENCRAARELGADAALVVLPYYNKPTPDGHVAHIAAAASMGLPLVVYHVPGRTGQRLPAAQLAGLANLPGVIAVKEATGDVGYGGDVLLRTKTPILSGDDFTFFPLMALGGAGVISVISNIAPAKTVKLAEAAATGDLETARALHFELLPVVEYLFHTSNPVPAKALMAAMGLLKNELRLPLAPIAEPEDEHLLACAQE